MQGKQQLCIHLLYESLVGKCEYTTQPKGSFLCHVIGTKGAVLLLKLCISFVPFILIWGCARLKAAAETQEC